MNKGTWLGVLLLLLASTKGTAQSCHYQDWRWNVNEKHAVQQKEIIKDYSLLTSEERDPFSGCSVCAEEQRAIKIVGLPGFSLCQNYAPRAREALVRLIRQGAKINSVVGYRVGRTRGNVDSQGNRAGFSNHSFGIAIDINTDHNGLYGNCVEFGSQCQLLRGGLWRPGVDPYSLQQDGLVVKMLQEIGFKWGGEIEGRQKDFMHFSPSGY